MRRILACALALVFLLPVTVQAQEWTAEQQELIDHLYAVWDEIEVNNQATYEAWYETVQPADDLVWWFGDQGTPFNLLALKKWHQWWGLRGGEYTYMDVRPIAVRIVDSVGMVWFWSRGEWIDPEGERHEWEDKRMEVFHKTVNGWQFLGGMVSPVDPFKGDAG